MANTTRKLAVCSVSSFMDEEQEVDSTTLMKVYGTFTLVVKKALLLNSLIDVIES